MQSNVRFMDIRPNTIGPLLVGPCWWSPPNALYGLQRLRFQQRVAYWWRDWSENSPHQPHQAGKRIASHWKYTSPVQKGFSSYTKGDRVVESRGLLIEHSMSTLRSHISFIDGYIWNMTSILLVTKAKLECKTRGLWVRHYKMVYFMFWQLESRQGHHGMKDS